MDSYHCTSPDVADLLQDKACGLCGTCSATRQGIPHDLRPSNLGLKKGDPPIYRRNGRKLAIAWHKPIYTVDPCGQQHVLQGGHSKEAGSLWRTSGFATNGCDQLRRAWGGVDLMDQRCKTYLFPHRSRKSYKIIFNHMIEMALVNAHIIYTEVTSDTTTLDMKKFGQTIAHHHASTRFDFAQVRRSLDHTAMGSFSGDHFVVVGKVVQCFHCTANNKGKKVRTQFRRPTCNVALCVKSKRNCYRDYHAQLAQTQ